VKLLVTGGCGFIGSNFVRHYLGEHPDATIVNLDKLTYCGNLENLRDLEADKRHRFVKGDIADAELVGKLMAGVDVVVNFSAESHVDRSILDPAPFIRTNIVGTQVLLHAARDVGVHKFVQVSTDEVYGDLGNEGYFTEATALAPNSPYSASKASADLMVRAYHHTFGLPAVITRCSNNYGPYQFPEKLIPLFITNALADQPVPIYGDGLNVRDWLYVIDHCRAIDVVIERGEPGEVYNIGGNNERTNLEITRTILHELAKPESLMKFVKDRPGHDRRYAIDSSKLQRELGWQPAHSFAEAMAQTVRWYVENREWWERVKSGAYRDYYQQQYANR
jgi:dTDP-glucose 4,6-dehydratase